MNYERYSNEELVKMLQYRFDDQIFLELISRFEPIVVSYYYRYRIHYLNIDDYKQEAMCVMCRLIEHFQKDKGQYVASLFQRMFRNHLINKIRQGVADKRGGDLKDFYLENPFIEEEGNRGYEEQFSNMNQPTAFEVLLAQEIMQQFWEILSELETQVLMPYLRGEDIDKISKDLKLDHKAVHNTISRCKIKLMKILKFKQ